MSYTSNLDYNEFTRSFTQRLEMPDGRFQELEVRFSVSERTYFTCATVGNQIESLSLLYTEHGNGSLCNHECLRQNSAVPIREWGFAEKLTDDPSSCPEWKQEREIKDILQAQSNQKKKRGYDDVEDPFITAPSAKRTFNASVSQLYKPLQ